MVRTVIFANALSWVWLGAFLGTFLGFHVPGAQAQPVEPGDVAALGIEIAALEAQVRAREAVAALEQMRPPVVAPAELALLRGALSPAATRFRINVTSALPLPAINQPSAPGVADIHHDLWHRLLNPDDQRAFALARLACSIQATCASAPRLAAIFLGSVGRPTSLEPVLERTTAAANVLTGGLIQRLTGLERLEIESSVATVRGQGARNTSSQDLVRYRAVFRDGAKTYTLGAVFDPMRGAEFHLASTQRDVLAPGATPTEVRAQTEVVEFINRSGRVRAERLSNEANQRHGVNTFEFAAPVGVSGIMRGSRTLTPQGRSSWESVETLTPTPAIAAGRLLIHSYLRTIRLRVYDASVDGTLLDPALADADERFSRIHITTLQDRAVWLACEARGERCDQDRARYERSDEARDTAWRALIAPSRLISAPSSLFARPLSRSPVMSDVRLNGAQAFEIPGRSCAFGADPAFSRGISDCGTFSCSFTRTSTGGRRATCSNGMTCLWTPTGSPGTGSVVCE